MEQYYRHGLFDDCKGHWANFMGCVARKTRLGSPVGHSRVPSSMMHHITCGMCRCVCSKHSMRSMLSDVRACSIRRRHLWITHSGSSATPRRRPSSGRSSFPTLERRRSQASLPPWRALATQPCRCVYRCCASCLPMAQPPAPPWAMLRSCWCARPHTPCNNMRFSARSRLHAHFQPRVKHTQQLLDAQITLNYAAHRLAAQ